MTFENLRYFEVYVIKIGSLDGALDPVSGFRSFCYERHHVIVALSVMVSPTVMWLTPEYTSETITNSLYISREL